MGYRGFGVRAPSKKNGSREGARSPAYDIDAFGWGMSTSAEKNALSSRNMLPRASLLEDLMVPGEPADQLKVGSLPHLNPESIRVHETKNACQSR